MATIKRSGVKAQEHKTGFESYDGPTPNKRGMYRAKISQFEYQQFKSGAMGFKILLQLEASADDPKGHAIYDGYTIFTRIVFGDKEALITREENLYAALGVKDEPTISIPGNPSEDDLKNGVKVEKIGGKSPIGLVVNADIKMSTQAGYEGDPEVDGIYKVKGSTASAKSSAPIIADDEEDLLEDEEELEEEGEDDEFAARSAELNSAAVAELKELAKGYEIKLTGLTKPKLIDAILDYEFTAVPEDEEELEEEEELEPEEEIEEEEELEDEEPEGDERAEREAELADLDRNALKLAVKAANPDFKIFKSTSDDDLRTAILDAEFGADEETPF